MITAHETEFVSDHRKESLIVVLTETAVDYNIRRDGWQFYIMYMSTRSTFVFIFAPNDPWSTDSDTNLNVKLQFAYHPRVYVYVYSFFT